MNSCNECGAILPEGGNCREYLNEMIRWDFEDFLGVGQIHHLTVLCYNLQHPSVYSQLGLEDAKRFLQEFVYKHVSFEEHDKRNRERLSSDVRKWKISGSTENYGKYAHEITWKMTAADIVAEGLPAYVANVRKWSEYVYDTLKETGNLE